MAGIQPGLPVPLQLGLPALDAFPRKLWSRLGAWRLRATGPAELSYPDSQGSPRLRRAIAAYVLVSRGISCEESQVFVTAGYRACLDLAGRVLLKSGERVWMEDPCYPPAYRLVREAGATVVPVAVDEQGMRVNDAIRRAPEARFAIVTPSHQAPLGVSLSLDRRMRLLSWAQNNDAWVIEDDYDSEFRYSGATLPALKSLDTADRVLYAGTFSKVLFPGVSLAYLIVPSAQVDAFLPAAELSASGCPVFTQEVVADFIEHGHFARHIKKMRTLYAKRRLDLAHALEDEFGDRIRISLQAGGMHLLVRIASSLPDTELAARAQAGGLAVQALSQRAIGRHPADGLLMGFTNVTSAEEARSLAGRLRGLLAV